MKNTNGILQTVTGYLKGEPKKALMSQMDEDPSAREEFRKIKNAWALLSSTKKMPDYQVENLYLNFKQRLAAKPKLFRLNRFDFLKYAAVFILATGLASLFFYARLNFFNKADSSIRYTTVYADKGQISRIMLPDSSVVWLNSDTKITYNTNFAVDNREIKLEGQAFFIASHNEKIPMRVFCNDLEIKDLGTRFDVCAYPAEKTISIVLESGKVEILNTKGRFFYCQLNPGEMAEYNQASGKLVTAVVNTGRFTSWKEGILIFRDDPMDEVLARLERRYNIDIVVEQPAIYKSVFTATIKNETLEEIFNSIGFACSVRYKIIRSEDLNSRTKIIITAKSIH